MTKNKRVTITINNDLDLHFRKLASSKMLFETGWYSKAVDMPGCRPLHSSHNGLRTLPGSARSRADRKYQ